MLQILFLLPFCLVSVVLVVVCSLAPRWRRYVFAGLVAPVAFGGCGIVGMFMIVLASDVLGIDQAMGFSGMPASTTLQGWVIPFVSFFLPGAGGAFFAVVTANRLQRFYMAHRL